MCSPSVPAIRTEGLAELISATPLLQDADRSEAPRGAHGQTFRGLSQAANDESRLTAAAAGEIACNGDPA